MVLNGGSGQGDPWWIKGGEAYNGRLLIAMFPLEHEPVYLCVTLIGGHFVIPCAVKG